jgi:hypothetical protein
VIASGESIKYLEVAVAPRKGNVLLLMHCLVVSEHVGRASKWSVQPTLGVSAFPGWTLLLFLGISVPLLAVPAEGRSGMLIID